MVAPTTSTPARGACPVCREARREHLFEKDGWPVARCARCGLVYVDAMLDRPALDTLYGRDYYEGEAFADYIGERELRAASARRKVAELARLVPCGSLLDVGCAAGFFLQAASERYDVTGVEISEFAARYAREQLGQRVFTGEIFDAPLEDESFDAVTLWDVVEHLADPLATVAEIARVTRKGGVLALSTGNVEGSLARRGLPGWDLMFPPGHLSFFSPRTLEHLLNRAGFQLRRLVADGRFSHRPRLAGARARAAAGSFGIGNVMTAFAVRVDSPRRRSLVARIPEPARRVPSSVRAHGGEDVDDATWYEIAARCPYATFFHTPMWRELAVQDPERCRDRTFLMRLPSGVRAVFPLQELLPGRGFGRYLVSTYPYGFGGPIADGTITTEDLRRLFGQARAATTSVTGNPRISPPPALPGWQSRLLTTQVLDLHEGYEALQRRFSKGHRAAITQARRHGVSTRVAASQEDYRRYYAVYEDSLRRWGEAASPRYPWSLFERGWELSRRHPDAVRLWLAEHEGVVISGAWVLTWNGHAMYWHAATLERAFKLRPANLVLATAIEDACERGWQQFDFGSSGGHAGPEAFKRRFGALERPLPQLQYVAPPLRATGALRGAVARLRTRAEAERS